MSKAFVEPSGIGPLTIVVCIKQVPLLSALRFDQETRRLVREGVPLEINELDVYALSEAIRLREAHGGEVIAITMGPPQAREALATALAMGVDRAIHLNDRAFAGADTAATAYTLAQAIQYFSATQQKTVDLIFCGRHSIDAETAQVGPEIAELLNLPQISAIQKIEIQLDNGQRQILATREIEEGSETLTAPLPTLVTAAERLNEGIWPDEHAIRAASEQAGDRIQVVTAADLHIDPKLVGQQGSPTWVTEVVADTHARQGRIIAESDPAQAVELLVAELRCMDCSIPRIPLREIAHPPITWPRRPIQQRHVARVIRDQARLCGLLPNRPCTAQLACDMSPSNSWAKATNWQQHCMANSLRCSLAAPAQPAKRPPSRPMELRGSTPLNTRPWTTTPQKAMLRHWHWRSNSTSLPLC